MKLPINEPRAAAGGGGCFGKVLWNSVLDMLVLRCQLDIHVEMSGRQWVQGPEFRDDISTGRKNLRDVSIYMVFQARRLDLSGRTMEHLARMRETGEVGKL